MTSTQLKAYGIALALMLVVVGFFVFRSYERAVGAREAQIASLTARNQALGAQLAQDSSALARIDTVKVYRQVTQSDTVLQHLIDTAVVHHSDTVWVTREVLVEAKATIDSTKRAANACCTLARDYKVRWAVADSLWRDLRKSLPSPAKPWIDRLTGAGACAGAVWLSRR